MRTRDENRGIPLATRFSQNELDTLRQAAGRQHEYVSSFIRRAAMAEAERLLADVGATDGARK